MLWFVQVIFAVYSGFSGVSLFGSFLLMAYNTLYTSIQPLCYVFEKDVSEQNLLKNPSLYHNSKLGTQFTWSSLLCWLLRATLQGLVAFHLIAWTALGASSKHRFGADHDRFDRLLFDINNLVFNCT
jgi:magnesium-transporting ATPase (P-type)